jgi:hypothetical protein
MVPIALQETAINEDTQKKFVSDLCSFFDQRHMYA